MTQPSLSGVYTPEKLRPRSNKECVQGLHAALGAATVIMKVMIMTANTCWELVRAQYFVLSPLHGRYDYYLFFRNEKLKCGRLSEWAQFPLLVNGNDASQSGSGTPLTIVFYGLSLCPSLRNE